MTFEEYIQNFRRFRKELPGYFFDLMKQYAAHDVVAQIENRITTTGKSADGSRFSPYSTKTAYTSGRTVKSNRIWRAMASSKEARRNLNWITIKYGSKAVHLFEVPGGYKQMRQLEGLQVAFKDFEYSGQMWRMFGVKREITTANQISITIGGRTARSQDLFDKNSKREGKPLIDMSQGEITTMNKVVDKEILKLMKRHKAA